MIKILPFAVGILAPLWFTSGAFAHENKRLSNLAEFDFYFENKSLNESTRHDNPLKTETTNNNDAHESSVKPQSEDAEGNVAGRKLKKLIHYFLSLLHSTDDGHEEELLHDHKFPKEPYSKDYNLETNPTSTSPAAYKGADIEKVRDSGFENSGGGKDSEYFDEGDTFKNTYKEESEMQISKSSIGMNPNDGNQGKISGGKQKNRTENQKLSSEDSRYNKKRANHSTLRTVRLSDEFIDEYINPPTETFNMESYGESKSNQPMNSRGRGNKTDIPIEESRSEKYVSKLGDRKLINSHNPISDNITRDMNTTSNKELEKDEFVWKENKKSDNTTHRTISKQPEDLNKNLKETSAVEKPSQNSFQSSRSAFFIDENPPNNKNDSLKTTSLSVNQTSKIRNQNSSSPDENNRSRPKISNIPRVRNDAYEKNGKNVSVLDDSRKIQASKKNIVNPEPRMHSKKTVGKVEKTFSQQQLNHTENLEIPRTINKTNKLQYENSSINTESENATDIPSERQFVKQSELERDENLEDSNGSQELKILTDSNTDSDSSEYSNSEEELYEYYDDEVIQLMSNFTNHFTETFSNTTTQSSENFTAPFSNNSMEIELPTSSKNDSNINSLPKTPGLFNSILEFLYNYSNSTWIKKLKEENRRM